METWIKRKNYYTYLKHNKRFFNLHTCNYGKQILSHVFEEWQANFRLNLWCATHAQKTTVIELQKEARPTIMIKNYQTKSCTDPALRTRIQQVLLFRNTIWNGTVSLACKTFNMSLLRMLIQAFSEQTVVQRWTLLYSSPDYWLHE